MNRRNRQDSKLDLEKHGLLDLKRLFEATKDIVFILDTEERHVYIAGQWLKDYNMKEEDFFGKKAEEIMGVEASLVHRKANAKVLQGEHVTYEWQLPSEDGTRYFRTSLSPIYKKK